MPRTLFLWIPGPFLVRGMHLPIMRAWGFEPSSIAFVWIKPNRKAFANRGFFLDETLFAKGMGHTTRQNAEYVVLGRRGKPRRLRKDVHQLIIEPRREHSRKPDEFYARVERYCTGPYSSCSRVSVVLAGTAGATRSTSSNPNTTPTTISPNRSRKVIAPFASALLPAARSGCRNDPPQPTRGRAATRVIEHLRWGARGDTWWTHIPTGGWRSPIEAAIFKSLGVRAGSPDLLIIRAGQPLFLELKAPGRNLSPAQTECHDALRRAGATVETADNIDTALAFLARAGVMR